MRNKFLILLFGLLLAVGWTNDASAQALPALKMSVQYARAAKIDTHQHECEFGAVSSETKSMYLKRVLHRIMMLRSNSEKPRRF